MKAELFDMIRLELETKLATLLENARQQQESLSNESKSSAGDKHETSRAMVHLEQEKLGKQIGILKQQLSLLKAINSQLSSCNIVETGAVVMTSHGNFVICVSAGQFDYKGQSYFAVSPASPIIQKILGQAEHDKVDFNGKKLIINSII